MKKVTPPLEKDHQKVISRKEALHKAGKYAAYTAATMMVLLSPAASSVAKNSPIPRAPHRPKRH